MCSAVLFAVSGPAALINRFERTLLNLSEWKEVGRICTVHAFPPPPLPLLLLLPPSQVWDEITISEEDESGKQVTSVIKVPAQVITHTHTHTHTAPDRHPITPHTDRASTAGLFALEVQVRVGNHLDPFVRYRANGYRNLLKSLCILLEFLVKEITPLGRELGPRH